jgi:phosphatidylglycerol:prolipoprotein diacylglycerol transferase
MLPIIFRIGPVTIYSWGFMVALAVLTALFVTIKYGAKEGIKPEIIIDIFVYVTIASIIGARLFYVIAFYPQYLSDPISILYLSEGGLVFLGGLFGGLLSIFFYVRARKINIWKILDSFSPGIMIGYGIGRIGCFLNGCCQGIALFGFVQPTQIYSSLAGFTIFAVLTFIYNRKKFDGQIFLFALLFYSTYRFFIEFIRYSPIHISIFTPSQVMALAVLILSSYALWKKNSI